jgi:hypothetical protein
MVDVCSSTVDRFETAANCMSGLQMLQYKNHAATHHPAGQIQGRLRILRHAVQKNCPFNQPKTNMHKTLPYAGLSWRNLARQRKTPPGFRRAGLSMNDQSGLTASVPA